MIRIILIFFSLFTASMAQIIGDGYLATSNGNSDDRVVTFGVSKPREYFESNFLLEAPHTKVLASEASSIKATWRLIGYCDGKAVYDLVHKIKAFGGDWAVKTVLKESESGLLRPVFSRETQPEQWPVTDTTFSFSDGALVLVDRYRENAKISGPYGHVILIKKSGWAVEDFTKHPQIFKNE